MFSKLTLATVLLAGVASAADFSISTPASLVVCQPAAISWTGGTADYILDVIPGGQVSAASLEEIASGITGTTTTWTVDLANGTYVTLKLTDSTGAIAYSSAVTIQAGSDTSCLDAAATSAAAAAGATATGAETGSAASAVSASAATSATSAAASSAAASSAAAASATSKASGTSAAASTSTSRASSSTSASASAAATSTGAGYLSSAIEYPAVILAAFGGIAALL